MQGWQDVTWRAGQQVDGFVDDAIRSGDYSCLSKQISSTLNRAFDEMHDTVMGSDYRTGSRKTYRQSGGNAYEEAQGKTRENFSFGRGHARIKASGSAKLKKYGGYGLAAFNLTGALVGLATAQMGMFIFFGIMAALLFALGRGGQKDEESIRKARRIMENAKGRDVMSVEEIASVLGQTEEETKKDLREMIRRDNLSGTVYLDKDETTLMLSPEAYQQYQEVMKDYRERKREEQQERKRQAKEKKSTPARPEAPSAQSGSLDEETKKILKEGRAFIAHVRQKNDEIPGEEMSAKLDRLERIMTRIFDQVEKDPKSAPDLRRLMSYYIPTTQKLIDTYATLDEQQITGSNISEAKKQIEDSIDAINDAYEKFLDSFFENTAFDVSTDVSVLRQMMAQDGLTEDELTRMRRQAASRADTEQKTGSEGNAETSGASAAQTSGSVRTAAWGGAAVQEKED